MIEMLVCGLMAWYHVDCVQFYFYEEQNPIIVQMKDMPGDPFWYWLGNSEIKSGVGIMQIWHFDPNFRDKCGMGILAHEYARFHLQRWDQEFCKTENSLK